MKIQQDSAEIIDLLVKHTKDPLNPKLLSLLGDKLLKHGQLHAAVLAFQALIQKQPGNVSAIHNMGTAYQGLLCYQEAIEAFQRALAISPEIPELSCSIGNVLLESGDAR